MEIVEFLTFQNIIYGLIVYLAVRFYVNMVYRPKKQVNELMKIKGGVSLFFPLLGKGIFMLATDAQQQKDILWSLKHTFELYPGIRFSVFNFGSTLIIHLLDPALIQSFFATDQTYYCKYRQFVPADVFGEGLPFAEGQVWKDQRNFFSSAFHFDFLKTLTKLITETVLEQVDATQSLEEKKIDGMTFSHIITLNVILQSFLGGKINKSVLNGIPLDEQIRDVLVRMFKLATNPANLLLGRKATSYLFQAESQNLETRRTAIQNFAQELLNERRQSQEFKLKMENSQNKDGIQGDHSDILDFFITKQYQLQQKNEASNITDQDFIDEFWTFMVAGIDTTTHLLDMVLYYIAQYPEVQQKVYQEIKDFNSTNITVDDFKKAPYLFAVMKETQRLYGPVTALFMRDVLVDHNIGDIPVQKGAIITLGLIENGLNENFFPDPFAFKPERWFGEEPALKDPFIFIPFGAGPRNCIGQHLAGLIIKTTVALLLQKYVIKLHPDFKLEMTIKFLYEPKNPVVLYLEDRNQE